MADMEMDEFMMRPLNIVLIEKSKMESRFYDARCIQIMLGELNILDFSMEEDTKQMIIQRGKEAVVQFM